jgi:hypothetical protein
MKLSSIILIAAFMSCSSTTSDSRILVLGSKKKKRTNAERYVIHRQYRAWAHAMRRIASICRTPTGRLPGPAYIATRQNRDGGNMQANSAYFLP